MFENFKDDLRDAFCSIIPIIFVVCILSLFMPIPFSLFIAFLFSSILLIFGTALFTFGSDISMMIIGERIGSKLVKSKRIGIILLVSFIIGTIVTIAEPDLRVFVEQIISMPSIVMTLVISIGVGISLLLSSLRSIFNWSLNKMLFIGYMVCLLLMFLVAEEFVPVAFDSGGVTTGTISIPFIMTLGLGFTANRVDKGAREAGLGLVSLCSVGPIIMVLLLGLFYKGNGTYEVEEFIRTNINFFDYSNQFWISIKDVLLSISPIIIVFIIFQLITKDVDKWDLHKIVFGLLITIVGLVLFFTATNVGFMDMGYYLGQNISNADYKYLLIPFSMIIAYFIAIAEPAVMVLNEQIEELTEGGISKKTLNIAIALGVSVATGLSIIRIFTNTSFFYYFIPAQILSLVLMFFTPKIFTAIAFDAGGAAGGALTSAFLLPISIGICLSTGTNVMTGAFGISAFISLAPLITIQLIGILYKYKDKRIKRISGFDDSIVDLEEV